MGACQYHCCHGCIPSVWICLVRLVCNNNALIGPACNGLGLPWNVINDCSRSESTNEQCISWRLQPTPSHSLPWSRSQGAQDCHSWADVSPAHCLTSSCSILLKISDVFIKPAYDIATTSKPNARPTCNTNVFTLFAHKNVHQLLANSSMPP